MASPAPTRPALRLGPCWALCGHDGRTSTGNWKMCLSEPRNPVNFLWNPSGHQFYSVFIHVNTCKYTTHWIIWNPSFDGVNSHFKNCTQWSKSVATVVKPTLHGIVAALRRVVEDAGGTLADNTNGDKGTTIIVGVEWDRMWYFMGYITNLTWYLVLSDNLGNSTSIYGTCSANLWPSDKESHLPSSHLGDLTKIIKNRLLSSG